MLNVGIMGVTGYAGEELLGILLRHPNARVTYVCAKIDHPRPLTKIFPRFKNRTDLLCAELDIKEAVGRCDLLFLALPHTVPMDIVPALIKAGKRVVDLSADYRLKDIRIYEKFYAAKHKDKSRLSEAIYGLPEIYRNKIKNARLVANPGCYPTAAILALAPVVSCGALDLSSLIIDAKSGVTGAGRKLAEGFLFSEVNEDFRAYKVGVHQHAPEINQELSRLAGKKVSASFVPHLLPLSRGILETIYIEKSKTAKAKSPRLGDLYKRFYKKEPFVRIKEEGEFPRLKDVVGTNSCDIAIKDDGDKVIIIAAIDNLLKGASGQAVQNMNIMYGFPEEMGLK